MRTRAQLVHCLARGQPDPRCAPRTDSAAQVRERSIQLELQERGARGRGSQLSSAAAIDDPLVSPLFAPDLSGLPPAVIVTADCDPLRDDGFRYAERLREAGVPVRFENYIGMPHAFLSLASLCPAAPVCIDMLVGELQA